MTHDEVRYLFDYDGEWLVWKNPKAHNLKSGDRAGTYSGGYRRVRTNTTVSYLEHRLIWLWVHGYLPGEIDHINGNGHDNRLENLRDVSHKENCRNVKRSKANTSGTTGVGWLAENKKWRAVIWVDEKQINLGSFNCKDAAISARKKAEADYGFHKNHGRG